MLLSELTAPQSPRLTEINRYLHECYGYRINVGAPAHQLVEIQSRIQSDLHEMKMDGATVRDAEYARKFAIHEGVRELLRQRRLTEERSGPGAGVFNRVCAKLGEYACECINTGDSVEEAVGNSMRVYRSSRYRFPDSEVEDEIRECINRTFECGGHDVSRDTLLDWEGDDWDDEEQGGASAQAISDAIMHRLELRHPEVMRHENFGAVIDAVEDVADFHAGTTDLGSSDVSGMVRQVLRQLGVNETTAGAIAH